MCNKQRNLEFRVRSNCQRYITIYFYFYSTKLEEIIIHPVRKKIPRKSEHRGKKSRAQKKRQHDTRPHCQLTARSKYERATFAKGSLNLSSTRVPKQSKPQSVHASRQIFSGPSPVNQAVPNPLSLSLCLLLFLLFAWCSNFASRQPVRFLDKGEATVCESCPRNRPQRPREARVHTRPAA